MKNRTRRTRRTRRNIRKRKTQNAKRIKGAGFYESNPEHLYNMLEKFITNYSNDIKTKKDMVQAVTEYKQQMGSIDDRDYLALRNYIWSKQYGFHDMAKIPPEKRPPALESTPHGICREIGDYFFKIKPSQEPTQEELAHALLSF